MKLTELSLKSLRQANHDRQIEWFGTPQENDIKLNYDDVMKLFRTVELAGEVGESANVIKKLFRELLGFKGSRTTLEALSEELGDIIIYTDLLAKEYGIDLDLAVRNKFNKTSENIGLETKL